MSGRTGDNEQPPKMGLQFDPVQGVVSNSPPATPIRPGESQEIMMGSAGKAILVGDEVDLESDSGDYGASPKGTRCYPSWLQKSSKKTKGIVGFLSLLLLAFLCLLIVGAVNGPSSPDGGNGISSAENQAMDRGNGNAPIPTPTTTQQVSQPNPTPTTSNAPPQTWPPTQESVTIETSKAAVNIRLPMFVQGQVPDFSDGLTSAELQNWKAIENIIERQITTYLTDNLPEGYAMDSIQVDRFDGYLTSMIRRRKGGDKRRRRRRHMQQTETDSVHTVYYSFTVSVNCMDYDCKAAPGVVDNVVDELSQLGYLQVSVEMDGNNADIVDNSGPSPTATDVVDEKVDEVDTEDDEEHETDDEDELETPAPMTSSPTAVPTENPVTPQPSPSPTESKDTPEPTAPLVRPLMKSDECIYTPCEACEGECSSDDECDDGLFCFQRRGYNIIPGCEGPGRPDVNYCYNPFVGGLTEENLLTAGECDRKDRCGKCRGDCMGDDDCEKGLFCYFRRFGMEMIPGCAGQGELGVSYCFDPQDLEGL